MEVIKDFEDLLYMLDKQQVKYLIIGGLAFIYHAKPRYTKDLDLWIDPSPLNIKKANRALIDFGSPLLLDKNTVDEIIQIGLPPNRIDLLQETGSLSFSSAWKKRIKGYYGEARANWIDIDSLIEIKRQIKNPRHQEDVRVLMEVKKLQQKKKKLK